MIASSDEFASIAAAEVRNQNNFLCRKLVKLPLAINAILSMTGGM